MVDELRTIGIYLGHLVKARSRHGVHSPFVYDLTEKVLRPQGDPTAHHAIELMRTDLLRSDQTIRVNDLGAGSHVLDLPVRRVSDIAKASLKPRQQAEMLFRLCRYFRPKQVLELGTSFGISTLYLADGADSGTVHTIEGCPQTFRIAMHHFERSRVANIDARLGSFQRCLPDVFRALDQLDLVFIDGHHAKEPTQEYFELCLTRAHEDTVFIFDDIHWSRGMESAWAQVKAHARVSVTIDLFHMGLVFLRTGQAKQHFVLRY